MQRGSVVVTGAAQGIGLGITTRLVNEGYRVLMLDRDESALTQSAALFDEGAASTLVADVSPRSTHERALAAALELGPLAGWVNNAGFNIISPIHEIDEEDYKRGMDAVLGGVFWGTSVAVEHFLKRGGGGSIVNMSSIQSIMAIPGFPAYAAAKGAINALTRQVAGEYAHAGIRCNGIAPGLIATPLAEKLLRESPDRESQEKAWDTLCPIGRWGRVEDVAAATNYLISDESSFVTGHIMVIDGGATVLSRGF